MNSEPNSPIHQPANSPILIGALGDIHGEFDTARRVIASHRAVSVWLCVGDIASDTGTYDALGAPIYWIHGNNENFDAIASGTLPPGLHHIANGTAVVPQGFSPRLTIAGLGGTFAPTWYDTPATELPYPGKPGTPRTSAPAAGARRRNASAPRAVKDDKRRHFVREEVDACKALRGVDIFMTHEAPKPFRPFPGGRGPDAGKAQINEVLAGMQPRLHLFGHHHRFSEQTVEGVRSVGLDLVTRSYLLIDSRTWSYAVQSTDLCP